MHRWEFLRQMCEALGGGNWKPYAYESSVIALDNANSKTLDFTVPLTDAKKFIWTDGMYHSDVAGVAAGNDQTFGGALIKFDEAGGFGMLGKGYFSIEAFFGRTGVSGGPRELPIPVTIEGGGTIGGNLSNKVAGANNITLTFIGLRQY